jgi:hypothetical protein
MDGSGFHAPVPQLYQGTTHSLVFICGDCGADATVNDFPLIRVGLWSSISSGRADTGCSAMSARLKAARSFHVAAERVLALDSSIQSTGLRPRLIASARLSF